MKAHNVPRQVNLAIVRSNALLTIVTVGIAGVTGLWWIPALLALDFTVRGFFDPRLSPFTLISRHGLRRLLPFTDKQIFFPPKQFAARVGLLFSATAAVLFAMDLAVPAVIVLATLGLFAALECVLNFCMGCVIYNTFIAPLQKRKVFEVDR
jgi:hypothetical protein